MASVPVRPAALAELIGLTERNVLSSTVAKEVFDKMWSTGRGAQAIVDEEGLAQTGDESAIVALVTAVLEENPDAVAQFRKGRTNIVGFLVGQVIKKSQGKANPKIVSDLMRRQLDA
jgi:aspartyl-tRNA(Asn)/glutamyl-tRNA(Gln) amidotransferase subunit B